MKVYLVTEEGRYRHRVKGVYHNPGAACSRAVEVAKKSDGYHEYDVTVADEDKDIDDLVALFSYRKVNGRVQRSVKL